MHQTRSEYWSVSLSVCGKNWWWSASLQEHLRIWHTKVMLGRLNSSPMQHVTLWGCVNLIGFPNDFRGKTSLWNTEVRFLELCKTYLTRWCYSRATITNWTLLKPKALVLSFNTDTLLMAALLMAAGFWSSGSLATSDVYTLLYGLLKSFEICLRTLPAKAADKHIPDAAVFSEPKSGWHHGGRTQGFEFQVKGNPCACQFCWSAAPGTGLSQILPVKAVSNCLQQIWAFLSGMLTMKPRNSLLHNPGSIAFLKLWLPVAFKWPVRMFHKKYLLVAHWHLSVENWFCLFPNI